MRKFAKKVMALVLAAAMMVPTIAVDTFATASETKTDVASVSVSATGPSKTYNKKAQSVTAANFKLSKSVGTVSAISGTTKATKAGTYTVTLTVKGSGQYTGTKAIKATWKIKKAATKITTSIASKTFKYSKTKKKLQYVNIKVKASSGVKVTYKTSSSKIFVKRSCVHNSKSNVLCFHAKKGTKKGTYYVTLTAKSNANYLKATKKIKIVVK